MGYLDIDDTYHEIYTMIDLLSKHPGHVSTREFIDNPKNGIVGKDTCLCKGGFLLFVKEDETDMSRWKGRCRES